MSSKRVKKRLNEMIQNENHVPDYVLDAARIEMKKNVQASRVNNTKKLYFKFAIPLLTTLILIVACIPLMIPKEIGQQPPLYGNSGDLESVIYSDLSKVPSLSITEYNATYQEDLLYIHNAKLLGSYFLMENNMNYALEENLVYQNTEIFFLVHNADLQMFLPGFSNCNLIEYVADTNVYYCIEDECYVWFRKGDYKYYFSYASSDTTLFKELCQNIIKN